jgi:hypothetical protein
MERYKSVTVYLLLKYYGLLYLYLSYFIIYIRVWGLHVKGQYGKAIYNAKGLCVI